MLMRSWCGPSHIPVTLEEKVSPGVSRKCRRMGILWKAGAMRVGRVSKKPGFHVRGCSKMLPTAPRE